MKFKFLHTFVDNICLDRIVLFFDCLADILNEEVIAILKWELTLVQEWKHTPVDQIRTISFCCVLVGNIGKAAKHLLAGSSLLSGRAVTRLHCKDRGTDLRILWSCGEGFIDRLKDILYLRKCSKDVFSCYTGLLCCLYLLGTTNISRILTGESELSQSKRVGTEGGCLTGWDQLIGCGNRIMDLGNNL